MTEKQQNNSFDKFAYGSLAGRFLQNKDTAKYATGALDVLAKEGLGLSDDAKGFIEAAYSSEKGIQTAASIYSGMFSEEIGKTKPSDLTNWYSPILSGLDDKAKNAITSVLGKQTESFGDISKKVSNAQYVTQSPKGMFKDEEIKKANETLKNYSEFFQVAETLDDFKFESLREKAVNATRDRELKGLASML